MTIQSLNHISLFVSDVTTSKAFYGGLLEFVEIPRPAFNFEGAWYALGNTQSLHIIGGRTTENPVSGSRSNHFAVAVADIEECAAFLRSKNLDFIGPKLRPDGVPQIFLRDPDGYFIEFTIEIG